MAAEQSMTEAIMQAAIEGAKVAILTDREANNPINNARPIYAAPRLGDPTVKEPIFDS